MNGLKIQLNVSVTDTTLPIIADDPIISVGGLVLLDFASNKGYTGSTPPALSGTLPNVAWKQAAAILGSGDATTLANRCTFDTTASVPLGHKKEFTSKRGLHIISSQVNQTANTGYMIQAATPIQQYMTDNPTHSAFMGFWLYDTRPALTENTTIGGIYNNTSTPNNNKLLFLSSTVVPASGSRFLGSTSVPSSPNVVGKCYRSVGASGTMGTIPTQFRAMLARIANEGAYQNLEINKTGSMIFYKVYIEDLTVSGRTFAEVDILFKSQYDAAFAVGGAYYGDSYTDPATLA